MVSKWPSCPKEKTTEVFFCFALWGTKQAERAPGVARAACFEPLARRIRQRWCLSGVTLHYIFSTYLSTSLCISPYILLWIPPCHSSPYFDISTWITINKSAYFLIVTLQKPCFSRILAENRLFDQKNSCFLDCNSMNMTTIVKWQTLKHAEVKYETLNRVLCTLRF